MGGHTPRYYRHAIRAAEYAAKHFEDEKVQCVLNLGDIIDGKCGGAGSQAVDDVLEALSLYKNGRIVHTYGETMNDTKIAKLMRTSYNQFHL